MRKAEQVVEEGQEGFRIDKFVSDVMEVFPRSKFKSLNAKVFVQGNVVKPSYKTRVGDQVKVEFDDEPEVQIEAEEVALDIMFENDDVLVLDKPQGMVVHPAAGNYHQTLAQGVMFHNQIQDSDFSEGIRPGIVHRLDKDTSGVIITAKHMEAQHFLMDQFANREVRKTYLAVTKGVPKDFEGEIEGAIQRDRHNRKRFKVAYGGKDAITRYKVLAEYGKYALIRLKPITGRTHQLRVHLAHIQCPILGDPIYSRKDNNFPDASCMLHAWKLKIKLPDDSWGNFHAPLPERFKNVLKVLAELYPVQD
jgi:23S rRNA pseudouridine1911/1915/1917 synthase